MKRSLFMLLLVAQWPVLAQQAPQPFPGEVLVQLYPGHQPDAIIRDLNQAHPILALRADATLSRELRMYHLRFNPTVSVDQAQRWLASHPGVVAAQGNRPVSFRAVPNDPEYSSQWQYNNTLDSNVDLDAEAAWDITTGGITAKGDTIVVAVIDDGIDVNHADFDGNLWVNRAEIFGDFIDNDNNGYVDDYLGWNVYDQNGNVQGGWHGAPVAGIIGARGNDGNGVAGVNWNVKIMVIVGGGGSEASAVASYGYVLSQRRRYNQTQGTEGAYVVSTNSSWGSDFGQPANAPLWCNMYDSLGLEGVVSCGATINGNHNVDMVGDLPTGCPSGYLISVTNINDNDVKEFSAGYGDSTIDIGAYGEDVYTVNGYFGGTSASTPHVAGVIGLMYSMACEELITLAQSRPDSVAFWFRELLLRSAVPNASLTGLVSTDGKLNMLSALQEVESFCETIGLRKPEQYTGQWEVYPNPATDVLHIVPSGTRGKGSYRLINVIGQIISTGTIGPNGTQVEVSACPAGWYVLELVDSATGYLERQKIVVE